MIKNIYKFESLKKYDYQLLLNWSQSDQSVIFRNSHNLNVPELTFERFIKLIDKQRCTNIIWTDQIRIGIVSSIIKNKDNLIHSAYIKPTHLIKVNIIDILKLQHKNSCEYFNTNKPFDQSGIQAVKHFQESIYNHNKIFSNKSLNFNYVAKL